MKLHLADGLDLPLEIAGRRTAVFGISGSGKSNTATLLIEQLLRLGEQVVLIDPKGEGWGLLSRSIPPAATSRIASAPLVRRGLLHGGAVWSHRRAFYFRVGWYERGVGRGRFVAVWVTRRGGRPTLTLG